MDEWFGNIPDRRNFKHRLIPEEMVTYSHYPYDLFSNWWGNALFWRLSGNVYNSRALLTLLQELAEIKGEIKCVLSISPLPDQILSFFFFFKIYSTVQKS